mgnify:CR=1 FL=1
MLAKPLGNEKWIEQLWDEILYRDALKIVRKLGLSIEVKPELTADEFEKREDIEALDYLQDFFELGEFEVHFRIIADQALDRSVHDLTLTANSIREERLSESLEDDGPLFDDKKLKELGIQTDSLKTAEDIAKHFNKSMMETTFSHFVHEHKLNCFEEIDVCDPGQYVAKYSSKAGLWKDQDGETAEWKFYYVLSTVPVSENVVDGITEALDQILLEDSEGQKLIFSLGFYHKDLPNGGIKSLDAFEALLELGNFECRFKIKNTSIHKRSNGWGPEEVLDFKLYVKSIRNDRLIQSMSEEIGDGKVRLFNKETLSKTLTDSEISCIKTAEGLAKHINKTSENLKSHLARGCCHTSDIECGEFVAKYTPNEGPWNKENGTKWKIYKVSQEPEELVDNNTETSRTKSRSPPAPALPPSPKRLKSDTLLRQPSDRDENAFKFWSEILKVIKNKIEKEPAIRTYLMRLCKNGTDFNSMIGKVAICTTFTVEQYKLQSLKWDITDMDMKEIKPLLKKEILGKETAINFFKIQFNDCFGVDTGLMSKFFEFSINDEFEGIQNRIGKLEDGKFEAYHNLYSSDFYSNWTTKRFELTPSPKSSVSNSPEAVPTITTSSHSQNTQVLFAGTPDPQPTQPALTAWKKMLDTHDDLLKTIIQVPKNHSTIKDLILLSKARAEFIVWNGKASVTAFDLYEYVDVIQSGFCPSGSVVNYAINELLCVGKPMDKASLSVGKDVSNGVYTAEFNLHEWTVSFKTEVTEHIRQKHIINNRNKRSKSRSAEPQVHQESVENQVKDAVNKAINEANEKYAKALEENQKMIQVLMNQNKTLQDTVNNLKRKRNDLNNSIKLNMYVIDFFPFEHDWAPQTTVGVLNSKRNIEITLETQIIEIEMNQNRKCGHDIWGISKPKKNIKFTANNQGLQSMESLRDPSPNSTAKSSGIGRPSKDMLIHRDSMRLMLVATVSSPLGCGNVRMTPYSLSTLTQSTLTSGGCVNHRR